MLGRVISRWAEVGQGDAAAVMQGEPSSSEVSLGERPQQGHLINYLNYRASTALPQQARLMGKKISDKINQYAYTHTPAPLKD